MRFGLTLAGGTEEKQSMKRAIPCLSGAVIIITSILSLACAEVTVDTDLAPAAFAARDVAQALTLIREPDARVIFALSSAESLAQELREAGAKPVGPVESEGFSIRSGSVDGRSVHWVIAADAAGLMYGGLELAEVIRTSGLDGVRDDDQKPLMQMRGVKFNIPLDVRTPSYTDMSDSAQQNIATVWDFDFWKEMIDRLARARYNFVSLWSLHPFPSMVRVPSYPEIALEDVQRSTTHFKENYPLTGVGLDAPEILDHVETIRRMTMDEKIAFWRKVMRYGKERNVGFYIVTWNIFVNGTEGKYGITDGIDNPVTADYFRQSVKQMFVTYPDLKGIGLTTGENMAEASPEQKEDWAFATYGRGVLEAAAALPGRKITLIHRQHQAGADAIARRFAPLIASPDIEFVYSFKYAQAHVMSSVTQPFHESFVRELRAAKTLWTLRNDDVYHLRWGAPDFVREFIRNIPAPVSKGMYYGSDQWVWGREFLSLEPDSPRQLELAKHWYHWLIWGRLGFNPDLGDDRFVAILKSHFPMANAPALFEAWQEASMIFPDVTGFHWGALDFQWYIEACVGRARPETDNQQFHDVDRFITLPPHPTSGDQSIPDYVRSVVEGIPAKGTTPVALARRIEGHADRASAALERVGSPGSDRELARTVRDIRAMAMLGRYYAAKIQGATELALARATHDAAHRSAAIDALTRAAGFWRRYARLMRAHYRNPLWLNRVGIVDWDVLTQAVDRDITIARQRLSEAARPHAPSP